MNLTGLVTQWFLNQLELMPIELLSESLGHTPARMLDRMMGRREAQELRALLNCPRHSAHRVPVVLLPGVMGSLLASVRGISALIWLNPTIIFDGHINLLDLNEQGTADASPDVEIVPVGIEKLTYLKLILTLARETRLYEFPYDWRRHLEWNAHLLHQALERWSSAHPNRRFVLVGHSLGGMLARTYLALYPRDAERRIERVIMLGSPLHGVSVAMLIFTGDTIPSQIVRRLHPNNDVIRFASNLPVSYQLLPPPPELFTPCRAYPADYDLYDARAWGLPHVRQDYLDDARRFHTLLANSDPQVELVEIAGCHRHTITDVRLNGRGASNGVDAPWLMPLYQDAPDEAGDDTVPLWSTRMDRVTTYYIEESHHFLPTNARVLRAVLALIHGERPELPREVPAPSGLVTQLQAIPLAQQVAELRQRLERGELNRDDWQKLFFGR